MWKKKKKDCFVKMLKKYINVKKYMSKYILIVSDMIIVELKVFVQVKK